MLNIVYRLFASLRISIVLYSNKLGWEMRLAGQRIDAVSVHKSNKPRI